MAVSPIFIRRLKRMIERLRDPHRLNDAEKLRLSEMLSEDEKTEVERRRLEQKHVNELMYLQLEPIKSIYNLKDVRALFDKIDVAGREAHKAKERAESYLEEAEAFKAMGYKNPNVLTTIKGFEHSAAEALEHYDSYLTGIFWYFDKLSPLSRLYVEHRGPRTWENLPKPTEGWENVVWPNHPNSQRQAYIEVLGVKLERLLREAGQS